MSINVIQLLKIPVLTVHVASVVLLNNEVKLNYKISFIRKNKRTENNRMKLTEKLVSLLMVHLKEI